MGKTIMVQGTGSDTGKSVIVSALCRIFSRLDYRVAPFKAQNMALNSAVTPGGGEIGRAQAVQAEAAGVIPTFDMNPVLLKPNRDDESQVIIQGRPAKNFSASSFYEHRDEIFPRIKESLDRLRKEYDIVVIEGAGSPAEINLRQQDMVNMAIALYADCPVLLVADIDRGGVFASIVGTLELLNEEERQTIKGIIINKFRGDRKRFADGIDFIEDYTGKKVAGLIPYAANIGIPEEDSLAFSQSGSKQDELQIYVIYLPHISNFTDFTVFTEEAGVNLKYIKELKELDNPDLIIIPGSKNTIEDYMDIKNKGIVRRIIELKQQGVAVVGICGGYQMLGNEIKDPDNIESEQKEIKGFGLLDISTTLSKKKITKQIKAELIYEGDFFAELDQTLTGYEIHQGYTVLSDKNYRLFNIKRDNVDIKDGYISKDGLVWGSYIHGIFDNDQFRHKFLNYLRQNKGLKALEESKMFSIEKRKKAYDDWADLVLENIDIDYIESLVR